MEEFDIFKVRTQDEIDSLLDAELNKAARTSIRPWWIHILRLNDKYTMINDYGDETTQQTKWYGYEAYIKVLTTIDELDITDFVDLFDESEKAFDNIDEQLRNKVIYTIVVNRGRYIMRPQLINLVHISDKYNRAKTYKSIMNDIQYQYENCMNRENEENKKKISIKDGRFIIQ